MVIIKRTLRRKSLRNPFNEMTTVLTRSGYMLKHSWGKKINNQLTIKSTMRVTKDGCTHDRSMLNLKRILEQDIRMKCMFLDKFVSIKTIPTIACLTF